MRKDAAGVHSNMPPPGVDDGRVKLFGGFQAFWALLAVVQKVGLAVRAICLILSAVCRHRGMVNCVHSADQHIYF